MPLESILDHILNNAKAQSDKITQQAKAEADKITQQAKKEAGKLYQDILDKEKDICDNQKQRDIVNARLEGRKELLKAKQEIIYSVFKKLKPIIKGDKFKKQQIYGDGTREGAGDADFYLDMIRLDYESEIAGILFG